MLGRMLFPGSKNDYPKRDCIFDTVSFLLDKKVLAW